MRLFVCGGGKGPALTACRGGRNRSEVAGARRNPIGVAGAGRLYHRFAMAGNRPSFGMTQFGQAIRRRFLRWRAEHGAAPAATPGLAPEPMDREGGPRNQPKAKSENSTSGVKAVLRIRFTEGPFGAAGRTVGLAVAV